LRAAAAGRDAKVAHQAAHGAAYDPEFTPSDLAAFAGPWGWFDGIVRAGVANGPGPGIDDDLAYVADWGFDPADIGVPTLLLHGLDDRVVPPTHSQWLASRIPGATLRTYAGLGHISVLTHAAEGLEWLSPRCAP
ncbi:alpha/beta hydrolase, partial [Nostocoides japonicum]|uniref:alpha/beta hydrolase n=1 Tax=Nostocoides japonicum TaxID=99481 RepID=UPI00065BDF14